MFGKKLHFRGAGLFPEPAGRYPTMSLKEEGLLLHD